MILVQNNGFILTPSVTGGFLNTVEEIGTKLYRKSIACDVLNDLC